MFRSLQNRFGFPLLKPVLREFRCLVFQSSSSGPPLTGANRTVDSTASNKEGIGKSESTLSSEIVADRRDKWKELLNSGLEMGKVKPEKAYEDLGYDYLGLEREWWKDGKRYTFWQNFRMKKDHRRRKGVEEWSELRLRLLTMRENYVLPQAFKDKVSEELHNLPRDSINRKVRNRCMFTSRQRGGVKRFRVSRVTFRHLADHSKLSGVIWAQWRPGYAPHPGDAPYID